ncbi:ATP-binding cassette domain-containing protein [Cohnella sp. GCM10027633]|uniref:ATP-binding cassette domain-containing protein n=1 Tax=unclassified Cohnella TaxID=2636738 RepID=UPI00362586F2
MLILRDIVKKYVGNTALYVGDLTLRPGEIVGLLGANGSGKTTLMKAIMGIGELELGGVLLDGKPLKSQYDNVAFITEEGSYLPWMTPMQYAEFLADYYPRFDRAHYEHLLRFYELPTDKKIRTMSKGQKTKVEICAGMAKRARVILMDEPFQGKDIFARSDFLKLMIAQLKGDEIIVITTHLIDEIENVIDRAIVLSRGAVRADVMVDELREQGRTLTELMADAAKTGVTSYKRPVEIE